MPGLLTDTELHVGLGGGLCDRVEEMADDLVAVGAHPDASSGADQLHDHA